MSNVKVNDENLEVIDEHFKKALVLLEEAENIWGENFDNLYYNFIESGFLEDLYKDAESQYYHLANAASCVASIAGGIATGATIGAIAGSEVPVAGNIIGGVIGGIIGAVFGITHCLKNPNSVKWCYNSKKVFEQLLYDCKYGVDDNYSSMMNVDTKVVNVIASIAEIKSVINEYNHVYANLETAANAYDLNTTMAQDNITILSVDTEVTIGGQTVQTSVSEAMNAFYTYSTSVMSAEIEADYMKRTYGSEIDYNALVSKANGFAASSLQSGLYSHEFVDVLLPQYSPSYDSALTSAANSVGIDKDKMKSVLSSTSAAGDVAAAAGLVGASFIGSVASGVEDKKDDDGTGNNNNDDNGTGTGNNNNNNDDNGTGNNNNNNDDNGTGNNNDNYDDNGTGNNNNNNDNGTGNNNSNNDDDNGTGNDNNEDDRSDDKYTDLEERIKKLEEQQDDDTGDDDQKVDDDTGSDEGVVPPVIDIGEDDSDGDTGAYDDAWIKEKFDEIDAEIDELKKQIEDLTEKIDGLIDNPQEIVPTPIVTPVETPIVEPTPVNNVEIVKIDETPIATEALNPELNVDYDDLARIKYESVGSEAIEAQRNNLIYEIDSLYDSGSTDVVADRLSGLGYSETEVSQIMEDRSDATTAIVYATEKNELAEIAAGLAKEDGVTGFDSKFDDAFTYNDLVSGESSTILVNMSDDANVVSARTNLNTAQQNYVSSVEAANKSLSNVNEAKASMEAAQTKYTQQFGGDTSTWSVEAANEYNDLIQQYNSSVTQAASSLQSVEQAKAEYNSANEEYDSVKNKYLEEVKSRNNLSNNQTDEDVYYADDSISTEGVSDEELLEEINA